CKTLHLILQQPFLRCHDFKIYLLCIHRLPALIFIVSILLLLLFSYIHSRKTGTSQLTQVIKTRKHWKNTQLLYFFSQPNYQSSYIGGGSATFSPQELESYLLPGSDLEVGTCFKFHDYIY